MDSGDLENMYKNTAGRQPIYPQNIKTMDNKL